MPDNKSTKMHKITHLLHKIDLWLFAHPKSFLLGVLLITIFFATRIPMVKIYSDFSDLLPQSHPYIQLHNEIKESFGGANVVIVGIEVEKGDIFTNEALAKINRITQTIDSLPGVNHNLVSSVTHRNTRKVWLSEDGNIHSEPYYDPLISDLSAEKLANIGKEVTANPRIYGPMVSTDLRMALVKAQLNEGKLDYKNIFKQIQEMRIKETTPGFKIYVTGQPMLIGWTYQYLNQLIEIFLYTMLLMIALLVLYFRKAYGVLIPLAGVIVSSIWGLGIISLFGYNLDPLSLVIPFLIVARALSHGVQNVERYYQELAIDPDPCKAARATFENLFHPGSLSIVCDAVGLILIAIGAIPLNTKLACYASIWVLTIIVTVLIAVPLLLTILPKPKNIVIKRSILGRFNTFFSDIFSSRKTARVVLIFAGILLCGGWYASSKIVIGESEPGSPILYQNHDYNVSSKIINDRFPGSEELYLVAETDNREGIKRPEVLHALEDLERYMMLDPGLGGVKGIDGLVKQVNRLLHNTDPRFNVIPDDQNYVGGVMYTYMMSNPVPGALNEFVDPNEQNANLVFYYKDHKGETIRRAIYLAKQWIAENGRKVTGLKIRLAGGTIGVTAAMNEAAYETNVKVVPLAFLLIVIFVSFFYSSLKAGLMMFISMLFATTLSYAYMGMAGLGLNINTVPIISVGIGVGIDYSIYMMDRIRVEMVTLKSVTAATRKAIATTGQAVFFTAFTLIAGIVMWVILSDLRFQADASRLLIAMVVLNALAALVLVPSLVLMFRPKFICGAYEDEDGIIHG